MPESTLINLPFEMEMTPDFVSFGSQSTSHKIFSADISHIPVRAIETNAKIITQAIYLSTTLPLVNDM